MRQRLVPLLALALIAALVALTVIGLQWREYRTLDAAGEDAERVAREAVTAMTTYDWQTVEDDFAWVDQVGTKRFRESFADVVENLIPLIKDNRATAKGTVVESAAKVHDAETVTVLVFVDQELSAAGDDAATIDDPRVRMEMVKVSDEWLVDEIELASLASE